MDLPLRLVDWTLKSSLLLLAAGALALALRNRSAGVRHLVWGLALGAVLVLPPLSWVAPQWSTPAPLWLASPIAARVAAPLEEPAPWAAGERAAPTPRRAAPDPAARAPRWQGALPSASEISAQPARLLSRLARRAAGLGVWLLVSLWLAGAGCVLAAILLGVLKTRSLRRAARPADPVTASVVPGLRARLDLRRAVRVLELDGPCMPMTFGELQPVVLLPAEAGSWPEDRLRAVVLHELAHVKRHDYLTQFVARLACAVYWFNPLAWLAARRLRVERELACDDLVLAAGSSASDYATHLLEIARGLKLSALAGVASIAMARPSQLAGRLLAVLDRSRARRVVTRRVASSGAIIALAVSLPLAGARTWEQKRPEHSSPPKPLAVSAGTAGRRVSTRATGAPVRSALTPSTASTALPVSIASPAPQCDWDTPDRTGSSSYNVSNDRWRIRISRGSCALAVDAEGEPSFNDNDDDVTGLTAGGYLTIRERDGDVERELEFKPDRSGGIERRWRVDRVEKPYDDEARAWLRRTLLVMFRRSGLDAERRAKRILAKGGVDAVLQELDHIPSDYAARKYFQVLLTRPNLDQATLLRVVRQAGQQMHSDFELTELLVAIAKDQPLEEAVRLAYVEAVDHIGSDFERHRALKAVLTRQGISHELAAGMLRSAQKIGSDFELASFLTEVAQRYPPDRPLPANFLTAASKIRSGFEHKRALMAVLTRDHLAPAAVASALDGAAGIGADFELAELLVAVATRYPLDDALRPPFFRAVASVGADFEHARVLKALLVKKPLTEPTVLAILESSSGIHSDFELAEVLIQLAKAYRVDERVRPAFLKAAEHIQSEYERGRVLSAIFPRTAPA
jgi:beta-lactamase regulating signal transducer with metallopeptidase domain